MGAIKSKLLAPKEPAQCCGRRGSGTSVDPPIYNDSKPQLMNAHSASSGLSETIKHNDSGNDIIQPVKATHLESQPKASREHAASGVPEVVQALETTSTAESQPKAPCEPAASGLSEVEENIKNDFVFLADASTVKHIATSSTMFIMRGLSGSGKSTIVRLLQHTYPAAVSCSADDYFIVNGHYMFRQDKLSEAHQTCQSKAEDACARGVPVVVIDNTNVRRWEMNSYIGMAAKYGYSVVLVLPNTPWRFNPDELAKRNKHGVDATILQQKVRMFDRVLPLYYGWMLNGPSSQQILQLGSHYHQLCVDTVPQFTEYMRASLGLDDNSTFEFSRFYHREGSSRACVHCTSFFAARGKAPDCDAYAKLVKPIIGKAFPLCVMGFVITPRTVGARIRLTPEQLLLWGKDDSEDLMSPHDPFGNSNSPNSNGNYNVTLPRFQPTIGPGSRAHITLGYARDSSAVQTGRDMIDIVRCEQATVDDTDFVAVDGGAIRCYGNGRCAVYLDEPLVFMSSFTGRY